MEAPGLGIPGICGDQFPDLELVEEDTSESLGKVEKLNFTGENILVHLSPNNKILH
jgi:hypothetical protein